MEEVKRRRVVLAGPDGEAIFLTDYLGDMTDVLVRVEPHELPFDPAVDLSDELPPRNRQERRKAAKLCRQRSTHARKNSGPI